MGRLLLALAITMIVTGCGTFGGNDAPSFSSGADMQDALNGAGLSCVGYEAVLKADREWGMESASDVGKCDVDNENVKLVVWKDKGQMENWAGMSRQMGCTMGKAFGVMNFDYVAGSTWSISDTSQTLANQIADKIGGQAVHVDCKDVETPES